RNQRRVERDPGRPRFDPVCQQTRQAREQRGGQEETDDDEGPRAGVRDSRVLECTNERAHTVVFLAVGRRRRLSSMSAISSADGRTLELSDAGDPSGFPVVVQHGTPSSRLLWSQHDALARSQGIRLIGYDRPGYGGSTRDEGRNVATCAADVNAIADALALERYATWGISGGGPHALACAALCDERLLAVGSLAAVAP